MTHTWIIRVVVIVVILGGGWLLLDQRKTIGRLEADLKTAQAAVVQAEASRHLSVGIARIVTEGLSSVTAANHAVDDEVASAAATDPVEAEWSAQPIPPKHRAALEKLQ